MVTPPLPSAETAIVGLCLKLALLVGFAVQVAHQVTVPDLADAHARKEHHAIPPSCCGRSGFRLFGPSLTLLSVIGAQRHNAMLAVIALTVLAVANVALVPVWGVVGAALAVAVATLVWLGACAVVLPRVSGLRTDVLHLAAHATAQGR